jgi:hypothetical protein
MPLGRILPWPSGTVSAQAACAARVQPSLARPGLGQRSARSPRPGLARPGAGASACGAVRATARHACSVVATSPTHGRRRGEKHGGASPARGRRRCRNMDVDDGARMARGGVDGGMARAARWRPTWDDGEEGQCGRDDARMRWRGVLTGASDGVDGGVCDDGGVARSDTRSAPREARRVARLSGRCCRNADTGDGAVARRQLSGRRRAVPTAPLRRGAARARGSHVAMTR